VCVCVYTLYIYMCVCIYIIYICVCVCEIREEGYWGDPGVDGRIILGWIFG